MPAFKLGEDAKKNFDKLELVINRLMRRAGPRVGTAMIPPVPIFSSGFNPINGEVVRAIVPADGVITEIALAVNFADGKETKFRIIAYTDNDSSGIEFNANSVCITTVNLEVKAGQVIKLVAKNPSDIAGVLSSMLYQITPDKVEVQKHLLDEVDKLQEDNNEGVL